MQFERGIEFKDATDAISPTFQKIHNGQITLDREGVELKATGKCQRRVNPSRYPFTYRLEDDNDGVTIEYAYRSAGKQERRRHLMN